MMRGQASLSPSGPKTNDAPTLAKSSSRVIRSPRYLNARWPHSFFRTSSAKTTCRLKPHITVFRSIALRLVDSRYGDPEDQHGARHRLRLGHAAEAGQQDRGECDGGAGRHHSQLSGRKAPDAGSTVRLGCHPVSTCTALAGHVTAPTTSACGRGGAPPSSIACAARPAASRSPFPSR